MEKIVYKDRDFTIVQFPTAKGKGYKGKAYEVVPVKSGTFQRLDDMEICPEPNTLPEAIKLMNKNRKYVRAYKKRVR